MRELESCSLGGAYPSGNRGSHPDVVWLDGFCLQYAWAEQPDCGCTDLDTTVVFSPLARHLLDMEASATCCVLGVCCLPVGNAVVVQLGVMSSKRVHNLEPCPNRTECGDHFSGVALDRYRWPLPV